VRTKGGGGLRHGSEEACLRAFAAFAAFAFFAARSDLSLPHGSPSFPARLALSMPKGSRSLSKTRSSGRLRSATADTARLPRPTARGFREGAGRRFRRWRACGPAPDPPRGSAGPPSGDGLPDGIQVVSHPGAHITATDGQPGIAGEFVRSRLRSGLRPRGDAPYPAFEQFDGDGAKGPPLQSAPRLGPSIQLVRDIEGSFHALQLTVLRGGVNDSCP